MDNPLWDNESRHLGPCMSVSVPTGTMPGVPPMLPTARQELHRHPHSQPGRAPASPTRHASFLGNGWVASAQGSCPAVCRTSPGLTRVRRSRLVWEGDPLPRRLTRCGRPPAHSGPLASTSGQVLPRYLPGLLLPGPRLCLLRAWPLPGAWSGALASRQEGS